MSYTFRFRETIGEIAGGLALVVLGTIWAVTSIGYGLIGEGGRLAPGTVPFSAGVILGLCGVAIVIKGILSSRMPRDGEPREAELDVVAGAANAAPASPAGQLSLRSRVGAFPTEHSVLSVYLLVLAGVLIMPMLGFAIAFALAIFSILRLVERQPLRVSISVAVVTALFGYLLFEVIFNLPLPKPFFL